MSLYTHPRKRFFPLRHKSVITPPVRKVISKPESFEVDCVINALDEVNIGALRDFINDRFGTSFNWKTYVYIGGLRDNLSNFVKVLEPYVDKLSFERHFFGEYATFRFKEKQITPGFRKMRISKKSRFYKETP
jgi:hypothetical protein